MTDLDKPLASFDDVTTSRMMMRVGWQAVNEERHRARLIQAHRWGRHTAVIMGCSSCALEVSMWISTFLPSRDVMRFFR